MNQRIEHPTSKFPMNELRDGQNLQRQYDLEERLLEFASAVIDLTENLPQTRAGNHVGSQILRSGTSPFPNHGEAEEAESREDFSHKLKICLKELRETRRWARLIQRKGWVKNQATLDWLLRESDELDIPHSGSLFGVPIDVELNPLRGSGRPRAVSFQEVRLSRWMLDVESLSLTDGVQRKSYGACSASGGEG